MPDLALFDFDGTLTTRETFPDFMRYAVPRPRLLVGGVLLAPVVFGYRRGWVGGNPTRASIVQVGLRGVDAARLRSQAEAFARDALPDVLRQDAMARLQWHRERGDRIVVVSGGLDVYLAPWCAAQGVELLCSVLAERDGRITGSARCAIHGPTPPCMPMAIRTRTSPCWRWRTIAPIAVRHRRDNASRQRDFAPLVAALRTQLDQPHDIERLLRGYRHGAATQDRIAHAGIERPVVAGLGLRNLGDESPVAFLHHFA